MSFQTGLSGLNAASKNLDVIGHNVANSGTVGFKGAQAQFADVFAASLSGGGASQVGIGTRLANVAQQFTQGNITATNNPLDLAINGAGFFQLSQAGATTYSRNGQFQLDKDNFVVTNGGQRLQGYQVDANNVVTGALGDMMISTASQPPQMTGQGGTVLGTGAQIQLNLDSRATIPATIASGGVFSPSDTASYNKSTSFQVYDSLGNAHTLALYFGYTGVAAGNAQWTVNARVDGVPTVAPVFSTSPAVLSFGTSGKLVSPTAGAPLNITIDLAATGLAQTPPVVNNAAASLQFNLDFSGSTQFGSAFGVSALTQDGYTAGELAGFSFGKDGTLQGRYTNGQARTLGQVALADFANPQGLQQLGDNQWAESPNSGAALLGAPGSAGLGLMQSSATEDSNVDLTAELVNMIVAQRAYQANAQTIKTQDAIQQTLINLR
ncbi:flagellar hook protein FlgE [Sulfurimicrobium lacus]|uniref:Flagellar hook protein FlgE n=1 Tax=Sulfurimicrobium lacus TaxID=2715678 RepID=A0A6F8VCM5_9PROT|nr:flagellar hook protein FlgE [Sulfurimicrobium lacus]BCB26712.1 flagellar hook protein FlgE [Sulfurimicrobium lacus]